jgi:hypothetical protein
MLLQPALNERTYLGIIFYDTYAHCVVFVSEPLWEGISTPSNPPPGESIVKTEEARVPLDDDTRALSWLQT